MTLRRAPSEVDDRAHRADTGFVDDIDADDARTAVALATELVRAARDLEPAEARRRAERLGRLVDDEQAMAFTLALTDQVARIADPARAARRLHDLVEASGMPDFLGPVDRVALRLGASVADRAPRLVDRAMRWRLRHESAGAVLPADDPAFTHHVERRHGQGIDLNINVLGEAILGEDEARRRVEQVLDRIRRPDVDYVSVKVSSVCAHVSSLAFDRSVERIADRLRVLYRAAATESPPVFINLDMEEYRDLELTLTVFMRLLDEPDLAGLDAGIVLQAYLPDSHDAFERLATWASARHRRGGGLTRVRIVKGANLAMERAEAELHGWPQAPYTTKAEVDASYKRLLDRALDPCWDGALRVGLASHNLFDVAWGLVRAQRLGTRAQLDLEMLEGMAPGAAEAVRRQAGRIRLYAPVVRDDELDAAIAYLVRRLDENTSPENFLGHQADLDPAGPAFAEQRDRFLTAVNDRQNVDVRPRRTQDRSSERRRFSLGEPFANEPDTDWSRPENRAWITEHLTRSPDEQPDEQPDAPARELGIDDVHAAVRTAAAAIDPWGSTPARARAQLLVRAAELLAARRGDAIALMAREAGKTIAQGDPEVSEAIDMANYYAREALRLDRHRTAHEPVGPVVVAPPWNFPLAIPAGGVLAALAAGNPVILKPAPETVRTATLLAEVLWEAGVPTDVLQLLPCPDGDAGRALVTHPDVGAVILTGAAETAERFLAWRPTMRLHAETSGKNAIVVTATADLDLAVRDLVASAFGHAGQKCSAASLAIVEQSVLDDGRFLAKLADATRSLRIGPAVDPSVDVGPLIGPPSERLRRALTLLRPGESWLVQPRPLDGSGAGVTETRLWSPGIVVGVAPGSFLHRTEVFGPVLGVMAARDLDHAIELQNATDFGLTGGLHSLDPDEIETWLARVEVGNAYVNRSTTGAIVRRQPFGGWKRSTVGPAAKAGGPDYVTSLCTWRDLDLDAPDDRLARAARSFADAWLVRARPSDPSALRVERNELRHVPCRSVLLRIEAGADPTDIELCELAARTLGVPLTISRADDEPLASWLDDRQARWTRRPAQQPERIRVLGAVPEALRRAAHEQWIPLDDRRPVADGDIELARWCRAQAVSITAHRHGNTRAGLIRSGPAGPVRAVSSAWARAAGRAGARR